MHSEKATTDCAFDEELLVRLDEPQAAIATTQPPTASATNRDRPRSRPFVGAQVETEIMARLGRAWF
jgi:hypothetical protein